LEAEIRKKGEVSLKAETKGALSAASSGSWAVNWKRIMEAVDFLVGS
jgi:hypothetical protein